MAVADEQQRARMIHRQHYGCALDHLVVIHVAAVGAGDAGTRAEVAGGRDPDASQHRSRWKFEFVRLTYRFAQSDRALLEIEVPGHDSRASLDRNIFLIAGRI